MAGIVNGTAKCKQDGAMGELKEVVEALGEVVLRYHGLPKYAEGGWVKWRKRHFNKEADAVVNGLMDRTWVDWRIGAERADWTRWPGNVSLNVDGVVYLTDGHASTPTINPQCRVLWALTSRGSSDHALKDWVHTTKIMVLPERIAT